MQAFVHRPLSSGMQLSQLLAVLRVSLSSSVSHHLYMWFFDTFEFYLFTYLFIYFYGDKVSCSPAWLPAHSIEEGGLELLILS